MAGESYRSLVQWLDDEGVRTVNGGVWRTMSLRTMLTNPRMAGLREHRGEIVGPAVWEPIITLEDRDRILSRVRAKAASGRRVPQRYLLSGLLRCGKCGVRLYSSRRQTSRRYVCLSGPDHGGCGRLTVVAEPVEDLITDAVLYRLDTPELAEALTGSAQADAETAAMAEQIAADRAQLDELAQLYAAKAIPAREWLAARNPIEERINAAERRLARAARSRRAHRPRGQRRRSTRPMGRTRAGSASRHRRRGARPRGDRSRGQRCAGVGPRPSRARLAALTRRVDRSTAPRRGPRRVRRSPSERLPDGHTTPSPTAPLRTPRPTAARVRRLRSPGLFSCPSQARGPHR
ncbi:MAG: recombinase family protein [Microthrixaceae bacterium]